jgi:copper(I)-binding protein
MQMKRIMVVMLLLLVVTACASDGSGTGALEVTDIWGRNSPAAAANGAFYMTIANNTEAEERLLSAASEACGTVELHEMYMKEGDVMGMRPVPDGFVSIPAGETVMLKVGGLHIMCIGKTVPFELGVEIPLTLEFANAGSMNVNAEIRESEMEMK